LGSGGVLWVRIPSYLPSLCVVGVGGHERLVARRIEVGVEVRVKLEETHALHCFYHLTFFFGGFFLAAIGLLLLGRLLLTLPRLLQDQESVHYI
jgi:hypothetical protein